MGRLLAENERKNTISAITVASSLGAESQDDESAKGATTSSENQNQQQSTHNDVNVNLQENGITEKGKWYI